MSLRLDASQDPRPEACPVRRKRSGQSAFQQGAEPAELIDFLAAPGTFRDMSGHHASFRLAQGAVEVGAEATLRPEVHQHGGWTDRPAISILCSV
jgi:hypothetical protein